MDADTDDNLPFSERVRIAAELLESLDADRAQLTQVGEAERQRLMHATRRVAEPDHHARRKLVKAGRRARKAARLQQDDQVLNSAGIRELRRKPVFTTPNAYREPSEHAEPRATSESQHCYVCKQHYDTVHFFYDQLCPACAELNFGKRTETADLRGRVALLTGGRVKIGYQAGIKLLRAGAQLIVTTRFPRAARRSSTGTCWRARPRRSEACRPISAGCSGSTRAFAATTCCRRPPRCA